MLTTHPLRFHNNSMERGMGRYTTVCNTIYIYIKYNIVQNNIILTNYNIILTTSRSGIIISAHRTGAERASVRMSTLNARVLSL